MSHPTLFDLLGGIDSIRRLAHAWHERVMADEVVSHAFSHGFHPQHTERIALYWSEAWGGPASYMKEIGSESYVVAMHSGNGEHEEMDRRAIRCFDLALNDINVQDHELRSALLDYFSWVTTKHMAKYPKSASEVPHDLKIVRWTLNGLQQ